MNTILSEDERPPKPYIIGGFDEKDLDQYALAWEAAVLAKVRAVESSARQQFLRAYQRACETANGKDWMDAALMAKQWEQTMIADSANPWREFVAEVVASAEGYEQRTGQKVNAEWVQRGRELLASVDGPIG